MSQNIKKMGNGYFLVYGDVVPLTSVPSASMKVADAATKQGTMDAATRKKLLKAIDMLENLLSDFNQQEITEDPGRIWEAVVANEKRREAKAERERQEVQRAYMERNPHKRGESDGGRFCMRKDGKFGYETPEDRVTVPARLMRDSAPRRLTPCEEAEAAYSTRNPHKRKAAK